MKQVREYDLEVGLQVEKGANGAQKGFDAGQEGRDGGQEGIDEGMGGMGDIEPGGDGMEVIAEMGEGTVAQAQVTKNT